MGIFPQARRARLTIQRPEIEEFTKVVQDKGHHVAQVKQTACAQ